jgi:phosphopantothenoylcysteine decarboxylase / phosphopantothenate---cysteine ligase
MGAVAGQRILLGVSGGIAAYKAAELVRLLRGRGAEVQVVMTEAATRFVAPMTFQALSGRAVRGALWDAAAEAAMGHIELARWADRIVVAPASADLIARLAHGLADDLLSTLCLASEAPLLLAPAMNRVMWQHAATQANVATLRARGAAIAGPDDGAQACGETGPGRMIDPQQLLDLILAPAASGLLAGRRVLLTAGPTFEDIDPVRFIGNRSSGRMGFAVAAAARAAGADVTLVAGPVALPTPPGVNRIDVRSAAQMRDAVLAALPGCELFIGAAAVADYRPAEVLGSKRKKSGDSWPLELILNPDILAEVAQSRPRPFVVGFAAETDQLEQHARAKLARKGLDLIAANRVGLQGCGFEAAENALSVYWADGGEEIPLADKRSVAQRLVELIAERMAG